MRTANYLFCVVVVLLAASAVIATAPADNPVANFYNDDRGYPAWTDAIKWSNVINMKTYAKGKTNFEKFENACRELTAKGGGVLYYPGGVYDFSDGPFDGPGGRGLMLPSGVVIRGQAPKGKPLATSGKLELATKFVFGFKKRDNAIDVGRRMTLVLDGGEIRVNKRGKRPVTYEPAELILSFAIENGKISSQIKAFRRGYGRDVWTGEAKVSESGKAAKISAKLGDVASYDITITRDGDGITGKFTGECNGRKTEGEITGREFTITPETPRDWNVIGLAPPNGKSVKDVNNVGVAWVHIVGGVIYFGPDVAWGETWATAGSWKSRYIKKSWANRKPDGTHPWDPFAGGGKTFAGSGSGRLVFGCVLEQSAVLNDSVRMGRPDNVEGFGENGYYTHKFGPRIAVYGQRVLVANNLLPMSRGRNFKYAQTTRRTFPSGKGGSMGFDPPRKSIVFFDYNKTLAIGINKSLLGLTKNSPTSKASGGYFSQGVTVIDNWVYNNGHKGYDVSGSWVTIARNHNERQMLKEGWDPERIGGWDVDMAGALFGWNVIPGWIGSVKVAERSSADIAFVANQSGSLKPMKGAQVGNGPAKPAPPVDAKAEVYENDAVKITWKDKCEGEAGFRIDRKIANGKWTPIAYRPPQITGHADNRPVWIDFLAPSGKELTYR
ncbi:MAG: hypothetical protein H8E53_11530, partial [Planctomycetes bacterium]|nr:hypothetical protein [Planctomycetota bacterium]